MARASQDEPETFAGRMLIATPAIGDPRFQRTLVYVCSHSAEHAMGIVVNRAMGSLRLPELLSQLDVPNADEAPDTAVLNGGPVEKDRGFVLHSDDYQCDEATLPIGDGVALTATKDVLEALASPTPPRAAVLALGYAGWGPGQLETEIHDSAWLICLPTDDLIFGEALEEKWAAALATLGVTPDRLSSSAGTA